MADPAAVVGMYTVPGYPDVYLIEIHCGVPPDKVEVGAFMQEDPDRPRDSWQVAYDERFLTPDGERVISERWSEPPIDKGLTSCRLAFFLHFVLRDRPLSTPFGPMLLPEPSPLPARLSQLLPYEEPD
jgi:hypothetical protein